MGQRYWETLEGFYELYLVSRGNMLSQKNLHINFDFCSPLFLILDLLSSNVDNLQLYTTDHLCFPQLDLRATICLRKYAVGNLNGPRSEERAGIVSCGV